MADKKTKEYISQIDKEFNMMEFFIKQLKATDMQVNEDNTITFNKTYSEMYDGMKIYVKAAFNAKRDEIKGALFETLPSFEQWDASGRRGLYYRKNKGYGATELLMMIYAETKTWAENTAKMLMDSDYEYMVENEPAEELAPYLYMNLRGNLSVNTSLLAEHIRQNSHYYIVKKQGSDSFFIYWYEEGYYKEISPNELKAKIKELIPLEIRKPSFWEDTYKDLIATDHFIGFEAMNQDDRFINFKNGLLDTKTWNLVPHSPDYRHIYQIQCDYDSEAKDPKNWRAFINTLGEGDEEMMATLQEWMGLLLSNYDANLCKKAVCLYGPIGNTGKSRYLNMVSYLVGIHHVCSKPIQKLSEKFGGGALYGKKCVLIDDQTAANIEDGSTFKAITGGGEIEAELKGKQPFTFKFKGGITITCNAMPYIKDDKGSHMFDRFLMIPCNNVIPIEQRDKNILKKLEQEAEGIALWAMQGLKRLLKNDFNLTEGTRSRLANEEYRKMNDTFFRFISENYEITGDKKDRVAKKELEEAYQNYCLENSITALETKNIPARAEANGIIYSKSHGYWYYRKLTDKLPF